MSFKLFGVNIKIDFAFYITICFSLLNGGETLRKLLIASAFHELGHIVMLYALGGKADLIKLSCYGIALRYSSELSVLSEISVLIAGPLVNLIIYFILKSEISFLLFLLNILPIYPLDGGRIFRLLFPDASRYISTAFLALLVIISVYVIAKYRAFSLLIICIYLIIYCIYY